MLRNFKTWAVAAAAGSVLAGAASAQPINVAQARALAQNLALTASIAERNVASDSIEAAVRGGLQNVIIGAGADPLTVLAAFDQLAVSCGPSGRLSSGWSCPGSQGAYRAILSVRSIVVAQIEQTDPAAFATPGEAPLGTVPSTSAGGSNYRSF